MKLTSTLRVAGIAAVAISLAGLAHAQDFTARIGHLESAQQSRHQGLLKVAELVSERTDGHVKLEIFPAGQLGQQREMAEGVQLGVIEGTMSPAAFIAPFNVAVTVLDMPFLYPVDRDQSNALRDGPFGQAVLDSFTPLGFKAITIWPNGRKSFTSNKAMDSVADFAGQRFRVMDSQVLIKQFEALGATALAIPFGELYTALQTGVVDGEENALDTIATMKYNEVQKYLLVSEHGANEDVMLFNPAWWNSLPADYQQVIVDAFAEARPFAEAHKEAAQTTSLEKLTNAGMTVSHLSDEMRGEMRAVMYPASRNVYLKETGDVGAAIVKAYEEQLPLVTGQ